MFPPHSPNSFRTKMIMPTTCLLAAFIAMLALHFSWPVVKLIPPQWGMLGLLPLAVGLFLNCAADAAFHSANTTVKPFVQSNTLVTEGVYRISRNPMYLGFLLILTGMAVLLGSLTPFVVIPVYAFLIHHFFIVVEERMLAQKFGGQWQDYQQRTRRWL
jgi:protein-S-isoprenylcysteine O-methyltransferase Ste14